MQQLRPEQVVADFEALLGELAYSRRSHVDAA
jgi:hypothetical protein